MVEARGGCRGEEDRICSWGAAAGRYGGRWDWGIGMREGSMRGYLGKLESGRLCR